ncbi:hypothetical protein ACE8EZ_20290 [Pantoea deleyi]|uniref:hypothetical protein n=1 Tax=Pantoea deleyi TaxID=470932 RepID=UPI0035D524F5
MYKKTIYVTVFIAVFCFGLFFAWYKYGISLGYSCTGNINFHKDSNMLRLTSKLRLNRDKGVLTLNGVLIGDDGSRKSLNRTIYFNSVNDAQHYTWTSVKITPSIDENASGKELQLWLPGFYILSGENIQLYISKLNFSSITISGELLPYMICTTRH